MQPKLDSWQTFSEIPRSDEALRAGDLQMALNGYAMEQLLELRSPVESRSDRPAIGFATVLWLLGDRAGAGHVLAQATETAFRGRYTHSAAGTFQECLLLWFASVRLQSQEWHNLANRTIDKLLRKKFANNSWPARLALLLQGQVELNDVESSISEPLRERQFPQAMFYAGVRALEDGNPTLALRYWDLVQTPKLEYWESEYFLAVHERNRLRSEIDAQPIIPPDLSRQAAPGR